MSAHEELARQRKAIRLADTASRLMFTADEVANSEEVRDRLVELAVTRKPSVETWKLVVSSLVAREARMAPNVLSRI